MNSANQIMEGVKESTGIDIGSLLAGFVGGKAAAPAAPAVSAPAVPQPESAPEAE
jgi:flotillin